MALPIVGHYSYLVKFWKKLRTKDKEGLTLGGAGCSGGQVDNGDLGNSQRSKGGDSNESKIHFVFLLKRD